MGVFLTKMCFYFKSKYYLLDYNFCQLIKFNIFYLLLYCNYYFVLLADWVELLLRGQY